MAKVDTNMTAVTAFGHQSVRELFTRWITYIVPVGAMCGDADVRDTTIHPMTDRMAVSIESSVCLDHCGCARDEKG